MHGHGLDGAPRCQNCQHNSRRGACARCGRVRPFTVSRTDGKPYCRGCRARNHLQRCAGCGNMRPVNVRDADGRGFCGTCYLARDLAPRERCASCGTLTTVAARHEDGGGYCSRCHGHPQRRCGICGRVRRVALRATATTPDICPTCFQAPEITCSVCGAIALGRRSTADDAQPMCFRCQAARRVDDALTGPEGTIPAVLIPVRDAIVATDSPRSILSNLASSKSIELLRAIAQGRQPLSHATLDAHAGAWSAEHVRALLVATAALPARDENTARLHRFVAAHTEGLHDPEDRRRILAFARWHVLPRLQRRYPDHVPPNAAHRCRHQLTTASRLLGFLRSRSRTLRTCGQDDLDAWFAGNGPHAQAACKVFLGWTRSQGVLDRSLALPVSHTSRPRDFSIAADRWARARSLLHDDTSATVPDRVAACLVLLYAQPVTHIAALTTDHLDRSNDGVGVLLRLRDPHDDTGLYVLPELARLLTQLPGPLPRGTVRSLPPGTWLFPGRRPGQPLHSQTIARRIRALGVDPRPDRNSALLELARELPPAVLGKLLGLHPGTAARWADTAGGNWARYAAAHRRK